MASPSAPGKPPGMPAEQFSTKTADLTAIRDALLDTECVTDLGLKVCDSSHLIHGVACLSHTCSSFDAFNDVLRDYDLEIGRLDALEGSRTEMPSGQSGEALTLVAFNEDV